MINTSNAYLVAINADTEQTRFLAEFGFVPPGAREGLTLLSSGFGQLWGSRLNQLNNRVYGMGKKWLSLELNRPTLGGGGEYINPLIQQQTGDWSIIQSNALGIFQTPPYIEMTLDKAYDLIGMQVMFDDLGEEWATEVKVGYYNASDVLLQERIFTNDRANMPVDWQYNAVKRIRITMNKWNLPRRFAKVSQVIPGQIRYFNDDNTFSFSLKESISPFDSLTIPEYTITFSDENKEYNIINPQGVISKLRERMEIPSNIGILTAAGIEDISTGNFPLFSWLSNSSNQTASFTCRPDLGFMDNSYSRASAQVTRTVLETAISISSQATLKTNIAVDPSLQNIMVNTYIGSGVSIQDALSQLAIAVGGYIKFERDGTYTLKPLKYANPIRTIDYDNMWVEPDIEQNTIIFGVNVRYLVYNDEERNMDDMEVLVPSGSEIGRTINITSGFIPSKSEAERIGKIALEYFNHRLSYSFDYRGDMSIEAGDVVAVETDYGLRNVLVLEPQITYDTEDYLQGRIAGVEI